MYNTFIISQKAGRPAFFEEINDSRAIHNFTKNKYFS